MSISSTSTFFLSDAILIGGASLTLRCFFALILSTLILSLGACAEEPVASQAAPPKPVLATQTGLASFYGTRLQGQETASGEKFDRRELVAAHPTYPFGTIVRVTNLENGRSVELRIIDRGPARKHQAEGVIIDLSTRAARTLGFLHDGLAQVRVDVLEWGKGE